MTGGELAMRGCAFGRHHLIAGGGECLATHDFRVADGWIIVPAHETKSRSNQRLDVRLADPGFERRDGISDLADIVEEVHRIGAVPADRNLPDMTAVWNMPPITSF